MSLVGTVLFNTYKIQSLLGRGGIGAVYRARHVHTNGVFAIKVLSGCVANTQDQIRRFREEAQVIAQLHHCNIVQLVEYNVDEQGRPFFVMELLDGENLHQRLCKQGTLSYREACDLVLHVGAGLQAAHDHDIVHCDIKPQNLFLHKRQPIREQGNLFKVLDFGISKICSVVSDTPARIVMATPQYLSPEVALGRHIEIDVRSDQFSLAVVLYRALSSHMPFDGNEPAAILYHIVHTPHQPLRSLVSTLPEHALYAIDRALSKCKDNRFDSISDFVSAFWGKDKKKLMVSANSGVLNAEPTTALPPAPVLGQWGASDDGKIEEASLEPSGVAPAGGRWVAFVAIMSLLGLCGTGIAALVWLRSKPRVVSRGPALLTAQNMTPAEPTELMPEAAQTVATPALAASAATEVTPAATASLATAAVNPDPLAKTPSGETSVAAPATRPIARHAAVCAAGELSVAGPLPPEKLERARRLWADSRLRLRRGTALVIRQSKLNLKFRWTGPLPTGFTPADEEHLAKYLRDFGSMFELDFVLDAPIQIACPDRIPGQKVVEAPSKAATKPGVL